MFILHIAEETEENQYGMQDTLGLTPKCHVIIKFNELLYFIIIIIINKR